MPPKVSMRNPLIIIACVLATAFFMAGCASTSTLHFRTVDARTGEPIAGVTTTYSNYVYDMVFGGYYHFGPTNLPPSNGNGVIIVQGVPKYRVNVFDLSCLGYQNLQCVYSAGTFCWEDGTNRFVANDGEVFLSRRCLTIPPTNGWFVIRLNAEPESGR